MSTAYDWITVGVFSGLVVLFLHRSARERGTSDPLLPYLVAAVGCALVNWLGNHGNTVSAILLLAGLLTFVALVLRPLDG